MPDCICDFPSTCNGLGYLRCEGCGGDQCVCAACFGYGETVCDGCAYCGDYDGQPMDDFDIE